jgi:hypothetical protein
MAGVDDIEGKHPAQYRPGNKYINVQPEQECDKTQNIQKKRSHYPHPTMLRTSDARLKVLAPSNKVLGAAA